MTAPRLRSGPSIQSARRETQGLVSNGARVRCKRSSDDTSIVAIPFAPFFNDTSIILAAAPVAFVLRLVLAAIEGTGAFLWASVLGFSGLLCHCCVCSECPSNEHKGDCFITTYGPDREVVNEMRVPNSSVLISWHWLADLLENQGVDLSLGVAGLDELYRLQAACHEAQIELLQDQIGTLEAALHPHLIPNPDIQRLLWIPGIGKVNAFTLYTEIDGIQFFSYCRLVPGVRRQPIAHDFADVPARVARPKTPLAATDTEHRVGLPGA